jgi:Fe-S cluster assembly protein SufD
MSVVAFHRGFHSPALAPEGPLWLKPRRVAAMEAFARTGIPDRRVEAWKYTDFSQALTEGLVPASHYSGTVAAFEPFARHAASRVVFVNGRVNRVVTGEGVEIVDLNAVEIPPEWVRKDFGTQASGAGQPLGAAALAMMQSGLAIRTGGKEATLHLHFESTGGGEDWIAHARILVVVESGSSLRILESHAGGAGKSCLNLGLEFVLSDGARVEHLRLLRNSGEGLHVATIGASLAANASYRALYVSLAGKLSRADAEIRLSGDNANTVVNSIAVARDGITDTTTVMDHAHPRTRSRQLFKSVVGGGGRSVAQGRVTVREGAVKSDSHQLFKALLLSPRAEADAKPELEIFADDVVCGHGTAIGALDEDAMFYLRARGICEGEARGLLVRAFLEEALEPFGDEDLRAALWREIDTALSELGSAA